MPEISKKDIEAVQHWQRHPLDWVVDTFGENIRKEFRAVTGMEAPTRSGLTRQQEQAFEELGKIINAKLKAHGGKRLSEEEKGYAGKIGISIMSGQGTGKDFTTALMTMFFLYVFPNPKVVATANTAKQLKNVLWSEISKVMSLSRGIDRKDALSKPILETLFEWQSEKVFLREKRGERWFAEAVTIDAKGGEKQQGEALGGRHEKFMLLVADEASGIPDAVFKPLEGTLTGVVNLLLVIFNPTKSKGFAIDSQSDPRFVALRWNSEESEAVKGSHCESMAARYGRDSNTYRIRVLGLPPLADSDTLIPWDWIQDAVEKEMVPAEDDPVMLGVDVGAGGDKSVIVVRQGGKIAPLRRNNSKDTMEVVGWVTNEMDMEEASAAFVDVIGIGKGVYDRLVENGKRAFPVDVRRTPRRPERFLKTRDEIWWTVREQFEKGIISIPDDRDLIDQLGCIKYKPDSQGRIKVEGKDEMRRRGLHSPDEADAVCLSYAMEDRIFRNDTAKRESYKPREDEFHGSWMTA